MVRRIVPVLVGVVFFTGLGFAVLHVVRTPAVLTRSFTWKGTP